MAYDTTPPVSKLSPPCGTRTLQALISIVLLLASTAAVVSGADYYRFQLTHVDANLGLSIDELMRRAYDRTHLRAATLYNNTSDSDVDSPILSPAYLSQAAAEYFMKFYMGQRTDATSAVVDTGSNLIWTTESECSKSKTRSQLPCSSHMCEQHANCRCSGTRCEYDVKYGGKKSTQTEGFLYTDSLTFLAPRNKATDFKRFDDIAIGCATGVAFNNPRINGIVGLGRGDQSLPGQLKNFSKFSYCLSSYTRPELPSYLLFATAPDMATGARSGATMATTGLWRNDTYKTWYFVDLQAISIIGGADHLDIALPGSGAAGGNMFVDSGASFTGLEESVFNELVAKLNKTMQAKQYKVHSEGGNICYSPPSSTTPRPDESMLPKMVLHFADSADMVLPWDSYLWYTSQSSKLCLTILKSEITGMSFLGNFQMQGIHMLFDTQNDKLSFVPADCSKV